MSGRTIKLDAQGRTYELRIGSTDVPGLSAGELGEIADVITSKLRGCRQVVEMPAEGVEAVLAATYDALDHTTDRERRARLLRIAADLEDELRRADPARPGAAARLLRVAADQEERRAAGEDRFARFTGWELQEIDLGLARGVRNDVVVKLRGEIIDEVERRDDGGAGPARTP